MEQCPLSYFIKDYCFQIFCSVCCSFDIILYMLFLFLFLLFVFRCFHTRGPDPGLSTLDDKVQIIWLMSTQQFFAQKHHSWAPPGSCVPMHGLQEVWKKTCPNMHELYPRPSCPKTEVICCIFDPHIQTQTCMAVLGRCWSREAGEMVVVCITKVGGIRTIVIKWTPLSVDVVYNSMETRWTAVNEYQLTDDACGFFFFVFVLAGNADRCH